MKYGEMHAKVLAQHAGMVSIANAVFGDDKGNKPPPTGGKDPSRLDLSSGHTDVDSAVAAINAALRF